MYSKCFSIFFLGEYFSFPVLLFENKLINELSGGQRQRVAIARAIVNNPKYLLADEPTGALDTVTAEEIVKLLKDINNDGTTVIIVAHETMVAKNCKRVISIVDGQIKE